MSKHKAQDNSGNLDTDVVIICLATLILAVILWFSLGRQFSSFMSVLRRYELLVFASSFSGAADLMQRLIALKGAPLEFGDTVAMLTKTGNYVRWLYVPPIVAMAVYLYVKSPRGRFRKRHSMTSLALQEQKVWPEISPVAGKQVELVTGDTRKGTWAVAMTEWEFAEKHKLAQRGGKLDRDSAREVFMRQLGPLWAGDQALPAHTRALLAALILRVAVGKDASLDAFRRMSATFATGGLKGMDVGWVDAVFDTHFNHPNVQRAISRHAYVLTLMATMLQISRGDGVVASPLFLWVKTVDRRLWYTLNNVGRHAFHVECAGIMAHWLFEKTVVQSCPSPMVEKAVDGLAMALDEYREDDALERLYS